MTETSLEQESTARSERLLKEMRDRWDRQDKLRAEQDEFYAEEFRRHVRMTKLWRKLLPFAVVAVIIYGSLMGYLLAVVIIRWSDR